MRILGYFFFLWINLDMIAKYLLQFLIKKNCCPPTQFPIPLIFPIISITLSLSIQNCIIFFCHNSWNFAKKIYLIRCTLTYTHTQKSAHTHTHRRTHKVSGTCTHLTNTHAHTSKSQIYRQARKRAIKFLLKL